MERKYIRKEVVTITKVEEVNFIDEDSKNKTDQLLITIWKVIKKYLLSYKWIQGKSDG